MMEFARMLRVLAGGLAAGAIGVTIGAGATAWADPLQPAPQPAPAVPAQASVPQSVTAGPGQATNNRLLATPPATNPSALPNPVAAPAAPAPAAVQPAAPLPPASTPATSGTVREYLQSKGVRLEPQKPQDLKALDITLPVPTRWTQVPDPNVPDAFAVIADRQGKSVYTSNAQVVVYKLIGDFDPREAITHGYVDSQKLLAWQTTNASMADFDGFPSSIIEGTYRDGDVTVNTSRRNVIATSGRDRYLVSLAVNTDRAVAVGDAPATDAIVNGFQVIAPGAAAPAPAQAPAPIGLPAAPAQAPAPVGLPAVQAQASAPVGLPATTAQASAPVGLPAAPAQAPAPVGLPAVPAQAPGAAPAGLPPQTLAPGRLAAPQAASQPTPNLLALVPGLPPLPNFAFLQGR